MIFALTLLGCGESEPTRSYCEAVCDWAVTCNATERTIDEEAERQECLDAAAAVDASCAKAEDGTIDPASKALLEPCVTAVDDAAAAGECDAFVGSIDEIKAGTPPADCLSQGDDAAGTFEAARDATTETGAELCQRFTDTFCARAEECILGDFAGQIPDEAITALGGTPMELCVQRLDPVLTADCIATDFYAAETSLDEVNAPRQAARECLRDFSAVTCESLFAGDLSETCAGAFSEPEKLVEVAAALYQLSEDFSAYASTP